MSQQTYRITHPETGQVIRMTGPKPPTEAEIRQAFAAIKPPDSAQQPPMQPVTTAVPPVTQPQDTGRSWLSDVAVGAAKGVGNTVVGLGKLVHAIPGVTGAVDALYGEPGVSEAGFAEANRRLEPVNTAQRVGKMGEQIAENLIPSRALTRAGVAVGARLGRPLLGRVATEVGAGAGMAAAQQGDPTMAGVMAGAMPVAGAAVRGVRKTLMPGAKLNTLEREAVDFATAQGVPIDAATATGRPSVSRLQKMASDNLGGAGIAEKFKDSQADALTRVGARLAEASNKGGQAVDPVAAGEGVRRSLSKLRDEYSTQADDAYGALRAIEAKSGTMVPIRDAGNVIMEDGTRTTGQVLGRVPMAVNIGAARKTLKPIYDRMLRSAELAQPMGAEARALKAIDRLMRSEGDYASLSTVDDALSDLKAVVRSNPDALGRGAGALNSLVSSLDAQVLASARRAGPEAEKALRAGRAATVGKYQVNDVLDALSDEPALVFSALTRRKDAGLETLRLVQKHSPQELPRVGRAYLEELMSKATAEGGFGRADALWADWQKLGPETKKLLFPTLTPQLDRFFLAAKMIARNPNPSGTASQLNVARVLGMAPNWALAKLMYTPTGVSLMTKAAQTGKTNELSAALGRILAVQGTKDGR